MISASDVAATLALLVPGFVFLKVFYMFGQRTKRADWEWTLWSVLVSAPIAYVAALAATGIAKPTDVASSFADCGVLQSVGKEGEALRSALTDCASKAIAAENADLRLLIALVIAVVGGIVAAVIWRLAVRISPRLGKRASLQAWDAILRSPHWVQVKVDDMVYSGKVDVAADPTETDALDIYLREPALIDGAEVNVLTATDGVLIARDKIEWIQVLK
jgi:hypothetical protein